MKKLDFALVSDELKLETVRGVALGEAVPLPAGVYDEYREAINSCDTVEELQLIRLNIMKETTK